MAMIKFVALGKEPLSLEHCLLVLLWVGISIGMVSGLIYACWIIRLEPAEQLSCHLGHDAW